jgi:RNA polymerase sigma-70 factor (ECF subfamily)
MTSDDAPTVAGGPSGDGSTRDGVILALVERGDDSAFEQLVEANQDHVARMAYRLLGWSGEVQDVVQEVFLAALKDLGRFRGQSSLSTWLTAITVNECRKRRRKWRLAAGFLAEWVRRPGSTPIRVEGGLLEDERLDRVRRAVAGLKRPLREVTVLRYFQEMPIEEVARALGLSVTAVHTRLHRARSRLKETLSGLVEE